MRFNDLTGQRFGELIVIAKADDYISPSGHHSGQMFGRLTAIKMVDCQPNIGAIWECKCTCGNVTNIPMRYLRNGNTKVVDV